MVKLLDDTKYLKYVLFHPFDGFYEAKHREKGNCALATIILVLYGIIGVFRTQYTGFIFNTEFRYNLNIFSLFMSSILPMILFIVSNWSSTTLMNGNGRLRDIYVVACYSLVPLILFNLITVLLSNIIIWEENLILAGFNYIGMLWFVFLIFSGLCTIHEYTVSKNIVTLLVTLVAAIIIIFLCVLYFSLMDKVMSFVSTISVEISKRW
ncbi:MAG: hypothetical protein K0S76_850 [Herbinix sp.]|nr:hypothetical protein [Herbinix sp.]